MAEWSCHRTHYLVCHIPTDFRFVYQTCLRKVSIVSHSLSLSSVAESNRKILRDGNFNTINSYYTTTMFICIIILISTPVRHPSIRHCVENTLLHPLSMIVEKSYTSGLCCGSSTLPSPVVCDQRH